MTGPFRRGEIVWAPCLDPRGRNLKGRPLLVINDAAAGQPVACLGISTQFDLPLPPTQVSVPYSPRRGCGTGLVEPSVVVCTWLVEVPPAGIVRRMGALPARHLEGVVRIVQDLAADDPGPASDPPK